MEPVLLTISEAAETLKCSRRQVWRLIAAGTLARPERQFGRCAVVLAESVFAALEQEYHPQPKPRRKRRRAQFEAEIDAVLANPARSGS